MKQKMVTGVDIGGSHITVGIIDLQKKEIIQPLIRHSVDRFASASEILEKWAGAIRAAWEQFGDVIPNIGFAMPGPFDYEKGICYIKGFDKYESLFGLNIKNLMAELLGIRGDEIVFRNDAEAFLAGEIYCGAASGFQHAIGITLGTGLGSAICKLGLTRDAELSTLSYNGEIIEQSVSTRGLLRTYYKHTGIQLEDAKALALRHDSDSAARHSFEKFSVDLAWFLGEFISIEQPEVLVIGGNIIQSWSLFMDQVLYLLEKKKGVMPKVKKSRLGESAALIGAAILNNES